MENRGQKRSEMVDELPADKRACSSLEFRPPSSSNSSAHTLISSTNSTTEANEHDMDTSSSASASSRSEGEPEKDYGYDSDDAEQRHNDLVDFHRRRWPGDHGKFKRILSSLSEETDPSGQLALLTELCEVLSFCTESSLSSMTSDSLAPQLVMLARHETNPDIMLLAIRAITYLCDVYPRSSAFLVRHDVVPALCQRLMAIEYMDVAEQCLQALEKMSREQPLACFQAGAIMAVLNYIDFFSTSIQRVAVSTVVNICKRLPSECLSPFMDAVPILCNLLHYEDRQLVENVAICLIKIVERVSQSSEMLDDLCKHGLIQQTINLLNSNGRTAKSLSVNNGLLGMLVKLCSGSALAFKILYEFNISSILKDVLSTFYLSHGAPSPHMIGGHCNQVYESLRLLNVLLPTSARDQDSPELSNNESLLLNQPDLLQKLGQDILPVIVQVVNSGSNLYVCYGCLYIIKKLLHLSTSEMLVDLLKNVNISSFLAGVFTRKDSHVLILSLQIAELILQKLSNIFLNSFIKEGVCFSIDALLTPEKCPALDPEKCSPMMFPLSSGVKLSIDSSQKTASREAFRCLCYAFSCGLTLEPEKSCKLEKDSVYKLAKNIRSTYFSPELCDFDKKFTDVLQKLKTFSAELNNLMDISMNDDSFHDQKEKFYDVLHQVIEKFSGEPISTFEFIESGIVKSFVNYLSKGHYLRRNGESHANKVSALEKRFEVFASLFLSAVDPQSQELLIVTLIRNLQNGLSSLESFPVILNHTFKLKNSYAKVPQGRSTMHPCLRVRFLRSEGEASLCDYSEDIVTVDPFSSMTDIEGYLWPKVRLESKNSIKSVSQSSNPSDSQPLESPSTITPSSSGCSDRVKPNGMLTDLPDMQRDMANLLHSEPDQAVNLREANPGESLDESPSGPVEKEIQVSMDVDTNMEIVAPSSSNEDASPKLLFFLEGEQVEPAMTLYQAIVQQQTREHETATSAKLWGPVYTLTYRRAVNCQVNLKEYSCSMKKSGISDNFNAHMLPESFFSRMFDSELASDIETSSSTHDILYLLKTLEIIKRFCFHLLSQDRICAFAEGKFDNLDNLKITVPSVSQNEFVNTKLTEKLEQQMRDSLAVSVGGMPSWCSKLMASCPFIFSFEARCKYFKLAAFGQLSVQPYSLSQSEPGLTSDRRLSSVNLLRKKFLVSRDQILDSATQMMNLHVGNKALLEVEYVDEVGTGLGPTLEFYTLVSHEFQKSGLGMWRDDRRNFPLNASFQADDTGRVISPFGLFPRPWSSTLDVSDQTQYSEVIKKFVLFGQIVAKALQDGRVMDVYFSKAFYKLILGQELSLFDIQSFDPELGTTLIEFKALVDRKKFMDSTYGENSTFEQETCFRNTKIEDLCLDFTLPGYPDYVVMSEPRDKIVNLRDLEGYISFIVDATINAGISRQVEAFISGFNQVFPIQHLRYFTEEELERLLCGEHDSFALEELLDHIKFDHGYTASSPPIINLLEVISEFDKKQHRAFLQFVTGSPHLPPGGLASLNPKLTIVRKHSSNCADADLLPSVMTCANYLKLPPYTSKEKMKEKLLYAITEGQGSFHLS